MRTTCHAMAVLSIIHIGDKKRLLWLLSDNKKMFVQIQIKININRNISNECLFLDIAPMHGIQFIYTVWCVLGPTLSKTKHSMLNCYHLFLGRK